MSIHHIRKDKPHCHGSKDDILQFYFTIDLPSFCTSNSLAVACSNGDYIPSLSNMTTSLHIHDCPQQMFTTPQLFNNMDMLILLQVTNSAILKVHANMFITMYSLTYLHLSNCSIASLEPHAFGGLYNLSYLNLSNNPFTKLHRTTFSSLQNIRHIDISHTNISTIDSDAVAKLSELLTLDLSFSCITLISPKMILQLSNLEVLNIAHIPATLSSFPNVNMFSVLSNLSTLLVTHAEICCMVKSDAYCKPDRPFQTYFASCSDIISMSGLSFVLHVFAVLNISTNWISFIWQLKFGVGSNALLQCCLNVADFTLGLYLSSLIVFNYIYQGDVAYVAFQWKTSVTCKIAGVVFMPSISMSNVTTMLIAVDRFICIVYRKFQSYGFTKQQCIVGLIVSW